MHIHLSSIEIANLPNLNSISRPNFFCVIQLEGDEKIQKNSICFDTFSPQWKDDFYLDSPILKNAKLKILVKCEDKNGTDLPISICQIELDEFQNNLEIIKSYDMIPINEENTGGKINIKLIKSLIKSTPQTNFSFNKQLLNEKLFKYYKEQPVMSTPTECPPIMQPEPATCPPQILVQQLPNPQFANRKGRKKSNETTPNDTENQPQDKEPKKRGRRKRDQTETQPQLNQSESLSDQKQTEENAADLTQKITPSFPVNGKPFLNQPYPVPNPIFPPNSFPNYPQPINQPGGQYQAMPPNQIMTPFQPPMGFQPMYMPPMGNPNFYSMQPNQKKSKK